MNSAGTRIRYQRIEAPVKEIGGSVIIKPIDNFSKSELSEFDAIIFSKCQDVRSIILAKIAREYGVLVGIDIFDDYFSQRDDPRFSLQRSWLSAMAEIIDFFLCSTPVMQAVAGQYIAMEKGCIISDPYSSLSPTDLATDLYRKLNKIYREKIISILWFGIAGNPNFSVGLDDLIAFSDKLKPFIARGYKTNLTILTNVQDISPDKFNSLRRIPIPYTLREWSEEREQDALASSFVSFLPVNHQPFSISKSMNRGISALTGGTQLLTAGYPLYRELQAFAYDDATKLLDDLERGVPKLSPDTIPALVDLMQNLADAGSEARRLVNFLYGIGKNRCSQGLCAVQNAVMHSGKVTSSIEIFLKSMGILSFSTPLTAFEKYKPDAQLLFCNSDSNIELYLSDFGHEKIDSAWRGIAESISLNDFPHFKWKIGAGNFLNIVDKYIDPRWTENYSFHKLDEIEIISMSSVIFEILFPGCSIVKSELNIINSALVEQGYGLL